MFILDALDDILQFIQALVIDIPVQNGLSALYVILNTAFNLLITLITGEAGDGGIGLPF